MEQWRITQPRVLRRDFEVEVEVEVENMRLPAELGVRDA
jgi:hypothetical protein